MNDVITKDRSLYIEGNSSLKTRPGGILTLIFTVAALIIIIVFANDTESRKPISIEFDMDQTVRNATKYSVPPLRIVFGFPSSRTNNLKAEINLGGIVTEVTLNNYNDDQWNNHFNFSKLNNFDYKYLDWTSNSSFTRVLERVPSKPSNNTPTQFYCIDKTNISTALRLNALGDVE
jgi:hypothetical protein